jgi:hypothetical protein
MPTNQKVQRISSRIFAECRISLSGYGTCKHGDRDMATGSPVKKIEILRAHMAAGEWQKALALAARFQQLGAHRDQIKRAHEAHTNARFYAQIGKDPAALIAEGIAALKARYGLAEEF